MHDVYMVYVKNTQIAQIRFILLKIINIYEYYETSLNPKKKQYHKA